MPKCHFTDAHIRKLKLPEGRGQLDYFQTIVPGRSLILTLNRSGRHAWSILFYIRGRPKRRKLGWFLGYDDAQYTALSCKQAKEAVRTFNVKAALTKVKAGSFKEVAEDWLERHASKLRSQTELRRHLKSHIMPQWGKLPFAEIRRSEVNVLLDKIENGHGPNQADAVLATVRSIMNWYQSRDENYLSPIVKGMKRDKRSPDEKARHRILDDDEIRAVWKATDEMGGFGAVVKLCLLTGQRKAKIVQMKWSHVDFETGLWTIATEEREKGNPGSLRLPQIALALIAAQPDLDGSQYVFSARARRKRSDGGHQWCHFNSWSQRKAELDRRLGAMPAWVIHDLRRTARSLMARVGVFDHIAERTLGHKQRGVQGIYNRHKYEEEKADALRRLATEIDRILKPQAEVVAFPSRFSGAVLPRTYEH